MILNYISIVTPWEPCISHVENYIDLDIRAQRGGVLLDWIIYRYIMENHSIIDKKNENKSQQNQVESKSISIRDAVMSLRSETHFGVNLYKKFFRCNHYRHSSY